MRRIDERSGYTADWNIRSGNQVERGSKEEEEEGNEAVRYLYKLGKVLILQYLKVHESIHSISNLPNT